MASDEHIFWDGFLHSDSGDRSSNLRRCRVCREDVRLDDPTRVQSGSDVIGHQPWCHSFDYADGLGLTVPTPPGVPLSSEVFWDAMLRPFFSVQPNVPLGGLRFCSACDYLVYPNDPLALRVGDSWLGHAADCRALAFATTLGLPSAGGGGGLSPVTLARSDITLARGDLTLATLEA